MKTKKFLFLIAMFLFIVTSLIVVMPNKAFATETMSDEFKQILNEEGKFVVTDTTMAENKQEFLQEYLQKYNTDSYGFAINYKIDETHYNISFINHNPYESETHDVEIVFEEKYSDEFKSILKDGKFQVPSSIKYGVEQLLNSSLAAIQNSNYRFLVDSYWNGTEMKSLIDENYTKATIVMRGSSAQYAERHIVELSYLTEPSEAFKTILKNGKLQVPSSTKDGVNDVLQSYIYSLSQANANYSFQVASYNENSTKVIIKMLSKGAMPKLLEQHEVELSYLTEQSEEFKKELNEDGKLVFNSVKPSNEQEMYFLFDLLFRLNNEEKGYEFGNPSEDFSSMDLTINSGKVNQETHKVEVVYNYDKTVKQKLQSFVNNFPKDIEYFHVKDLELINYLVNNVENDGSENLDAYSGELKSAVNNSNIEYYVDNRAGEDSAFFTVRLGVAMFKYNDIIYHIDKSLGTKAEHIIYVPDTTGNSKEELIATAQKRINEYL